MTRRKKICNKYAFKLLHTVYLGFEANQLKMKHWSCLKNVNKMCFLVTN